MGRLDDIPLEDLHELKEQTDGETPQERVLAAIGRKQGDTLDRLAERHAVVEKTIRNWLDRFVERPLEDAPYDAPRPGVPGKLSAAQKQQLFAEFNTAPPEVGYDRQAWTSSLAVAHIESEYGVEYSKRHARALLEQADLSYRTARPRHHEADPAEEAEFQKTVEKNEPS